MKQFVTLLFFAIISASSILNARTHNDIFIDSVAKSNRLVFIDGKPADGEELREYTDSVRRRIAAFYYDQFHHFMDPGAPYFLFLSKDSKLAMGIGGARYALRVKSPEPPILMFRIFLMEKLNKFMYIQEAK